VQEGFVFEFWHVAGSFNETIKQIKRLRIIVCLANFFEFSDSRSKGILIKNLSLFIYHYKFNLNLIQLKLFSL
jgi:hypothetical protein